MFMTVLNLSATLICHCFSVLCMSVTKFTCTVHYVQHIVNAAFHCSQVRLWRVWRIRLLHIFIIL